MTDPDRCPCGNLAPYAKCCKRIHHDPAKALTAEQLMRARYSAFASANLRFLLDTLHPLYRKPGDRSALKAQFKRVKWLHLSVIAVQNGGERDTDGMVEFVATYSENQQLCQHHERSLFIRIDGRWYYQEPLTVP